MERDKGMAETVAPFHADGGRDRGLPMAKRGRVRRLLPRNTPGPASTGRCKAIAFGAVQIQKSIAEQRTFLGAAPLDVPACFYRRQKRLGADTSFPEPWRRCRPGPARIGGAPTSSMAPDIGCRQEQPEAVSRLLIDFSARITG